MIIKLKNFEEDKARKLELILQDESFVDKVFNLDSIDAAKVAFEEKGLVMTDEELNALAEAVNNAAVNTGELTEDDLSSVSGGGAFTLVSFEWKVSNKLKVTVNIPW